MCPTLCDCSMQPRGLQHARLPYLSSSHRVCPSSCPLIQSCHPTISSSVTPFSFWLQSFPASESFPVSRLFALGGQVTGASASAAILPMNDQGWLVWSPCSQGWHRKKNHSGEDTWGLSGGTTGYRFRSDTYVLKCLYIDAQNRGCKQNEIEIFPSGKKRANSLGFGLESLWEYLCGLPLWALLKISHH